MIIYLYPFRRKLAKKAKDENRRGKGEDAAKLSNSMEEA
jgi:hypothetical protein